MTNRETLEFALGETHSPALRVDFSDAAEGLNRNEFPREGLNFDARCGLRTGLSSDRKTALASSGQNAFSWREMMDSSRVAIGESVDKGVEFPMKISDAVGVLVYGAERGEVAFGHRVGHPFSFGATFARERVAVDALGSGMWNEPGGALLHGFHNARTDGVPNGEVEAFLRRPIGNRPLEGKIKVGNRAINDADCQLTEPIKEAVEMRPCMRGLLDEATRMLPKHVLACEPRWLEYLLCALSETAAQTGVVGDAVNEPGREPGGAGDYFGGRGPGGLVAGRAFSSGS